MAQLRSADPIPKCPMLGVDRTYSGHPESDANDPERSLASKMKGSVSDDPA